MQNILTAEVMQKEEIIRGLTAGKLNEMRDEAEDQFKSYKGLHLNSRDWEAHIEVGPLSMFRFINNGIITTYTVTDISKKRYNQGLRNTQFKELENLILLLFLLDIGESELKDFLQKVFLHSNYKISCTCPAFLYWGFKYILTQRGDVLGPGENRYPKVRNPDLFGIVCKHLWLVLGKFEDEIKKFIDELLPYYKRMFGLRGTEGLQRLRQKFDKDAIRKLIEKNIKLIDKLGSEVKSHYDRLVKNVKLYEQPKRKRDIEKEKVEQKEEVKKEIKKETHPERRVYNKFNEFRLEEETPGVFDPGYAEGSLNNDYINSIISELLEER